MAALIVVAVPALPTSAYSPAPAPVPDPVDCEGPAAPAEPGTNEFRQRDAANMFCAEQRKQDQAQHPNTPLPIPAETVSERPSHDAYRQPSRHHNVRFRFQRLTIDGIAAEVYRPCPTSPTVCPSLPATLQRFDPPYPAVVVLHGLASNKENHWWASQPFAEAGYLVVAVDGTGDEVDNALAWLNSPTNPLAPEIDTQRVGVAGHSLGGGNALGTQGDQRVSAIVAWDPCSSIPCGTAPALPNTAHLTPTLYEMAEYTGWPGYPEPKTAVPGTLRTLGFASLRGRGVDTMAVTGRATTHLDFISLTAGNRLAEAYQSYFNLAWFDRYLKGKLVLRGDETPAQAEAERTARQAIARQAFDRLTTDRFDGSADRHNISQGFFDPALAAGSADPLYGGNVPYKIAGKPVADRLSFYHRSVCYISVPDYARGTGAPGGPVVSRADTTAEGDMRVSGCRPQASSPS